MHNNKQISNNKTLSGQLTQLSEDQVFRLENISLAQGGKPVGETVSNGLPLVVAVRYVVKELVEGLRVYVDIKDNLGVLIFRSFHDEDNDAIPKMHPGVYESVLTIPEGIFAPSGYILSVHSGIYNVRYTLPESGIEVPIRVIQTGKYNRAYPGDPVRGQLALVLNWDTEMVSQQEAL
jgi:lipopolysaccharide transport system ATP-binding protein